MMDRNLLTSILGTGVAICAIGIVIGMVLSAYLVIRREENTA